MKNYKLLAIEAAIYDNVPPEKGRDEMLVAIRRDAAELASLREANAEMLKALEGIATAGEIYGTQWDAATMGNVARAAISKHKG